MNDISATQNREASDEQEARLAFDEVVLAQIQELAGLRQRGGQNATQGVLVSSLNALWRGTFILARALPRLDEDPFWMEFKPREGLLRLMRTALCYGNLPKEAVVVAGAHRSWTQALVPAKDSRQKLPSPSFGVANSLGRVAYRISHPSPPDTAFSQFNLLEETVKIVGMMEAELAASAPELLPGRWAAFLGELARIGLVDCGPCHTMEPEVLAYAVDKLDCPERLFKAAREIRQIYTEKLAGLPQAAH